MRGLSASIVLFHHVYSKFPSLFMGKYPDWVLQVLFFISNLNVHAVLFFFFLSGFSICLSVKNGLPVTKNNFNHYVYRRLKRILPLYYLAIVFTLICGRLNNMIELNDDFSIKNLLGNIFFLQSPKAYHGNWFAPFGDNGPLWSLSFEMFYYFFLPVFLFLILKIYRPQKLTDYIGRVSLMMSFFLSVICVLVNKFFFFPYIAFTGLFYIWYAGFFTAQLYLKNKISIDINFYLLSLLAILFGIINYATPSATLYNLLSGAIIPVIFLLLFLLRKKLPQQLVATIENKFNFIFYTLGTGSYSLYLLHYPALTVLKKYEGLMLWQMVVFIALFSVGCVYLERYFVQKKWLFLKRRFI